MIILHSQEHSYPKNPKICDLILVTLLKMRAHCSQSRPWKCGRIQRHIPISLFYIVPSSGTTTANICAYFKCIVSYCCSRQKITLVQHPWIMRGTHLPLVLVYTKLPTRKIQYIPVKVCSALSLFQFSPSLSFGKRPIGYPVYVWYLAQLVFQVKY